MKFIYVSDLHGDNAKYRKVLSVCKEKNISNIVIGGDLYARPKPNNEVQLDYIRNDLNQFFAECEENAIRVIFVLGNLDLEQYDIALDEVMIRYPNVHYIDKERFVCEDVCFIGLSDTLDGPGNKKNRVVVEPETPMEKQFCETCFIEKGTKEITSFEWEEYRMTNVRKMKDVLAELPKNNTDLKTIYVFHQPPYGVGLDLCSDYYAAGSKAVLEFLKNNNAYMSLHGHMHDSFSVSNSWKVNIGNCITIQTGQSGNDAPTMNYTIIDTAKDTCKMYTENV